MGDYRISGIAPENSDAATGLKAKLYYGVFEEKEHSILTVVVTSPLANTAPINIKLKGLDRAARYSVDGEFICSGSALMESGYTVERMIGDYPARQIYIEKA